MCNLNLEHPVDQLADDALQAAAAKLLHWLAGGVPPLRGPTHRLRERRLRVLRGPANQSHTLLQAQLRYAYQQGKYDSRVFQYA